LAGDDGFDKPLGKPGLTRANTRRPAVRDTAPEPPVDMSKLTVMELASRLNEGSGQAKVLAELFRRASAGEDDGAVADAWQPIVQCLRHGDDWSREAAARLLGLVRCQPATEPLIDALEDSDAKVRSAAATALTRITRQLFGPGDDATPDERRVALTRWREWFARQSKPSSAR
jgi:aconitase B